MSNFLLICKLHQIDYSDNSKTQGILNFQQNKINKKFNTISHITGESLHTTKYEYELKKKSKKKKGLKPISTIFPLISVNEINNRKEIEGGKYNESLKSFSRTTKNKEIKLNFNHDSKLKNMTLTNSFLFDSNYYNSQFGFKNIMSRVIRKK